MIIGIISGFASKINANGVPVDEMRSLPGHINTMTNLSYIYNPLPGEFLKDDQGLFLNTEFAVKCINN